VANAVHRRHSSSHQCRAVGHADAGCDIKAIETRPAGSERVNVRRAQNVVAVTSDVIRPLLVGNEQQKIWTRAHVVKPIEDFIGAFQALQGSLRPSLIWCENPMLDGG
jgi:methylaspartate ammonia-lyase